jgi:hypothetical protein
MYNGRWKMEDVTIWVDIVQNISNNGKRISKHGNKSTDNLDKTNHNYSKRLIVQEQKGLNGLYNAIIDYDYDYLQILSDTSGHAKFIIRQYEKNTKKCDIFIIIVFFVSILSVGVKDFYDFS